MTETLSDRVRELAARGLSRRAIADELHWNRDAVTALASREGIDIARVHAAGPRDAGRLEDIRRLVAEKLSAAQIGKQLGMTRCAVIGMCRRNGLALAYQPPARPRPKPSRPKRRRRLKPAAGEAPTAAPEKIATRQSRADYARIAAEWPKPHECRYIAGDPRPSPNWCRKRAVAGLSWCAEHVAVVASANE